MSNLPGSSSRGRSKSRSGQEDSIGSVEYSLSNSTDDSGRQLAPVNVELSTSITDSASEPISQVISNANANGPQNCGTGAGVVLCAKCHSPTKPNRAIRADQVEQLGEQVVVNSAVKPVSVAKPVVVVTNASMPTTTTATITPLITSSDITASSEKRSAVLMGANTTPPLPPSNRSNRTPSSLASTQNSTQPVVNQTVQSNRITTTATVKPVSPVILKITPSTPGIPVPVTPVANQVVSTQHILLQTQTTLSTTPATPSVVVSSFAQPGLVYQTVPQPPSPLPHSISTSSLVTASTEKRPARVMIGGPSPAPVGRGASRSPVLGSRTTGNRKQASSLKLQPETVSTTATTVTKPTSQQQQPPAPSSGPESSAPASPKHNRPQQKARLPSVYQERIFNRKPPPPPPNPPSGPTSPRNPREVHNPLGERLGSKVWAKPDLTGREHDSLLQLSNKSTPQSKSNPAADNSNSSGPKQ